MSAQLEVTDPVFDELSGTAEISDEGIKKHFKTIEPWEALFELVWNGLDANAPEVVVNIAQNEMGGIESVTVLDNGDGIDIKNVKNNFGRFNDSLKKEDAAQHGSHGRGRLAFHVLCHTAIWDTKNKNGLAKITVKSSNIKKYSGQPIDDADLAPELSTCASGTYVELIGFHNGLPTEQKLQDYFSIEFGWFLALNPSRKITINNNPVAVPGHGLHQCCVKINGHKFEVKVIRWHDRPSSEKSYTYLLNSSRRTVYKQLSSFNNKSNFFTSIYITSEWGNNFSTEGDTLFSHGTHNAESDEWRKLLKFIAEFAQGIYEDFLRAHVEEEIAKYIEDGIFPTYENVEPVDAKWRLENTKAIVRAVYTADPTVFSALNKKQKKVIVRLLDRMAISNENDAIFDILNSVLDLDSASVKQLANQLKHTKLENIVATIEVIQQRQIAVTKLRELLDKYYAEVLETPDLQKIIENNTWLFGPRYEILGAEDTTFTQLAKNLRANLKDIDEIELLDVDADEKVIAGAKRQTDLFLSRKIPSYDSLGRQIYRCIIIEIKRPGIALNKKHLRQLDDYADIIKNHSVFNSCLVHFELVLIGRKISSSDNEIRSRLASQVVKGEMGLVSDDERMKRYVLNWATVLDSFDLSNNYMLQHLKLSRDSLTLRGKDDLVNDLQTTSTGH
jgi:hypothetical protein